MYMKPRHNISANTKHSILREREQKIYVLCLLHFYVVDP